MSVGVDELWIAGLGVANGVVRGGGVALGTSKRPRRCDAVGKADADDVGVDVVNGVDDCSGGVALRGVIAAWGVGVAMGDGVWVADIVADGNGVCVDAADVDVVAPSTVWGLVLVAAAAFTNFFGGAFGGGVASDLIFSRAFLAAS